MMKIHLIHLTSYEQGLNVLMQILCPLNYCSREVKIRTSFFPLHHMIACEKNALRRIYWNTSQVLPDFSLIRENTCPRKPLSWHYSRKDNSSFLFITLTLSCRGPLSYRNQSIDLRSKSMDWFLYDNGLRYERVKSNNI